MQKGGEAGRILAAGAGFDTAGDIEAPRLERGNGSGDIAWGEAAGEDNGLPEVGKGGLGGLPVEGDPGASGGGAGTGVDQDGIGGGVRGDVNGLLREGVELVGGGDVGKPVKNLDDPRRGRQGGAKLRQQ